MARVSAPPTARPQAETGGRPPRRSGRRATITRWVSRPALAVALLGVAVAVSVVEGQPSTVERPSGVSVQVPVTPYTGGVGTLLVVAKGHLIRFDTAARTAVPVPMPPGLTALRAWTQSGHDLVLGRLASGRTAAYVLGGRVPRALGYAETVAPSADRGAVWLVVRRTATRVPLAGGALRSVTLPQGSRLVGDTPSGLVVSTGTVPDPRFPGKRTPTPSPRISPATPTVATPSPPGVATTPPSPTSLGPTALPTTPPYTTASPVPSSGPGGVPLTTMVVSYAGTVRFLADAEALAATGDVVLLRGGERQLGVISPRPGPRVPRWLPNLSAVQVTGPGTLDDRGTTFAVLARQNDYARLMVGPTTARTDAAIRLVELAGGPPTPAAAPPTFTASGRVLVPRPDGRVVYFTPGERRGYYLGDDVPTASSVSQA